MNKSNIGLIGLAVMGENLVLNMANKGFKVSVYNRTISKVDDFINGRAKGKSISGYHSLEEFVSSLEKPRKVMLMVKAGKPVDDFINQLIPFLEPGDIIIDGGNSHFPDSIRRTKFLEEKGLLFIGTGISGGEEGALNGPSIMPGGSSKAWDYVKPVFQSIAAKVKDGTPCCDWVGNDGAGHFVKMVHNGIEYGDMQLISEAYFIMKKLLKMSAEEIHKVFSEWNKGELNSYLIEITAQILSYKDEDGLPLIDKILDAAGQKGTGKWTVINASDLGVPLTLIAEAVFARSLSSMKAERVNASKILTGPVPEFKGDKNQFIDDIRKALYASKIVSYTQGYVLMKAAAEEYNWKLNYGGIAMLWREGCIIRSIFLDKIKEAFERDPGLPNLLLDPFFKKVVMDSQNSWRKVAAESLLNGIYIPAITTALTYFDGYRSEQLPANLLQAQRDFFGAHMYERIDKKRGEFYHTNWTGRGGATASTAYSI